MNKKQRAEMYAAINYHGKCLLELFPNATERDPIALCKKLRRLETKAQEIGLRLCNGPEYADGEADRETDKILAEVNTILGNDAPRGQVRLNAVPVFINRDPRGYALKIQDSWMTERLEQWQRQIAKQGKKAITGAYWALLGLHKDLGGYGILAPDFTPADSEG